MNSSNITLDAVSRDEKEKKLSREGFIPAVVYGKGYENSIIKVEYHEFRRVFEKAGQHAIVRLKIDGKKEENVIIKSYDMHPVKDLFRHIDFMKVSLKEKIDAKVPIVLVGESPAVKNIGGILSIHLEEIEIKGLPSDIPSEIEVDISSLEDFHSKISLEDLSFSDNLELITDPSLSIVSIVAPKLAEEAENEEEGGELEKAEEGKELKEGEKSGKEESKE